MVSHKNKFGRVLIEELYLLLLLSPRTLKESGTVLLMKITDKGN